MRLLVHARTLVATSVLIPALFSARSAWAQGVMAVDFGSIDRRQLVLLGRAPLDSARTATPFRATALPLEMRSSVNSARPWGINDGPVWQGRGATTALSGGVELQWGRVKARINPVLWSAANTDFALSPIPIEPALSPFAYPTAENQRIDAPQRFGDAAVTRLDPGQSSLSIAAWNTELAISTETRRWGPGRRNSIILGQHAGGFGHVFLGTERPADIRIGKVAVQWLWGRLSESGYFDNLPKNDSRYISGASVSFFPKFVPGLELGANRSFVSRWRHGGPSLSEALVVFIPLPKKAFADSINTLGDDKRDQMASIFARWAFPASGVEVYAEWARGDHSWDLRDFLIEPEHATGYTIGLQKVSPPSATGAAWQGGAELTVLGGPRTSFLRAPGSAFYVHHIIRQGYTQRGQVLGAGIGPGSSQVSFDLARLAPWGKAGVTLQRTVYDNDRYYLLFSRPEFQRHEAELAMLGEALLHRGNWDLGASLAVAKLYNKYYVLRDDETNVQLGLMARYRWP